MHAPLAPLRNEALPPLQLALRKGLLPGTALVVAIAFSALSASAATQPAHPAASASGNKSQATPAAKAAAPKAAAAKGAATRKAVAAKKPGQKITAKKAAEPRQPGPLADFGPQAAPADVVHVANWVSYTHNAGKMAFVVIDKKNAEVYVFEPNGKLKNHSPVLLGEAVGDDSAPGIGNKPLSQIRQEEKTTPAGRFRALPGKNTHGANIIWIDYNAAVSMHAMHQVSADEHRAERLASPEKTDNRISYGCVNVPPQFFNSVLRPTVVKYGAFIYVLPETRTPQQQFGSFDVDKRVAQASSRP
jgi:hypothetical protein